MKKSLILLSLSCVSFMCAQTTIVDEKFNKENKPVGYVFLSKNDNLIVYKGKDLGGLAIGGEINNMYSYDEKGNKKSVIENVGLFRCSVSSSESTIKVHDISVSKFKPKVTFLNNGKFSTSYDYKDKNYGMDYFGTVNFNDKYEFSVTNQKDKSYDIDFQKDDIKLEVTDINTRKSQVITIQKPSINRLVGADFVEVDQKVGFNFYINDNETFLVTKSISKDYTKTILYKTNYSTEGKILNEIAFELKLQNHVFLYSFNGGGNIEVTPNGKTRFRDDSSINNFYEDKTNGDIYIYGLYGDQMEKLNSAVKPVGYYVFKFDKTGKKIWETVNKMEDKHLNGSHSAYVLDLRFREIKDSFCVSVGVNENKEYVAYGLIDKLSGNQTKTGLVEYHQKMNGGGFGGGFITQINEIEDVKELRGKNFDTHTMIAMQIDPKISNYVKSLKPKNDLHFASIFSDKGIWLIETDNKEYYKVTLF